MKGNIVVALLVGGLVGFAVGRATVKGGADIAGLALGGGSGPDSGKSPTSLPSSYVTEAQLPAGTLTGLNDQQKYAVLKVINEKNCDCGCSFGSIANCRVKDPNCPKSPTIVGQAVALAKAGKSSDQIRKELDSGAAAPARRPPSDDPNVVYKVPVGDSPVKGPATAKVTIVEFSDFQCPFCSRVVPTAKQIEEAYKGDVRIVFKQNPLPFHQNAAGAAEAALAAHEQGKFWEMHDKLFANQQALSRADLDKYAGELKLDMGKFRAAVDNNKFKDVIAREQGLAGQLGASGTPAFFINGKKLVGAQPFEQFKTVIDAELKHADELLAKGTSKDKLYEEIVKEGVTAPPAAPAQPQAAPKASAVKVELPDDAPAKGAKNAKATIVMFSDFQCPFCSRVEPTLKQITDTYGKDVRIVWRHQPLPFHPNAMPAAEAAEAAREQGKFWEMHDKLFANQQALSPAKYEEWAKEIGLNMGKYKAAVDSHKYKARIEADSKYGNTIGANGTPAFYINGRELSGAQPFESFKAMIDEEIKKADELLKKGVKPGELYAKIVEQNVKAAPAPAAAPAAPAPDAVVKIDVGSSPAMGPKDAPVTIVAFSDFQCPFCSRAVPTLKQIEDAYKGKVRVAFKQMPLPFHQNAQIAAEAALAANEQGKFWEMHDKLFANQQALSRPDLERYAQELGLDGSKFKAALDSGKYKAAVEADKQAGQAVGANGTPTFFINGRRLVGAQPFEQFKTVIDDELAKKVAKK